MGGNLPMKYVAVDDELSPEAELGQKTKRRYPVLLDYDDHALEQAFLQFYAKETRPLIQAVFVLSVPMWAVGLYVLFRLIPEHAVYLASISMALVTPFALFALLIRDHPRCLHYYQPLALFSNLVSGLLVMYICLHLENMVPHMTVIGMMLMLFIGFYALRLRARYAIFSSLVMVGAYSVYLFVYSHESEQARLLLCVSLVILELFACVAAYLSEYTYRQIFEQQQLIALQRDRISCEHERAEALLLNILPASIADRLRHDENIIADHFDQAAVLFADIVGFTRLASQLPADALVTMLNRLFSRFDDLVDAAGLEKIKTIGDAYMVAAGMPQPVPDVARRIADLALAMQHVIADDNARKHCQLQLRIGIHIGPVIAGVIGARKFIYDVWGDTVNIASRMESHGEPGKIQVSEAVYEQLKDDYHLQPRGCISIKGKGQMRTWFLIAARSLSDFGNRREK